MTTIEGNYFDGRHPIAVQARMVFMGREVALTAGSISGRFSTNDLTVSPRVSLAQRFVALPNGGQFGCADNAVLDSLPQENLSEGLVAWLEARWIVALASVAITFLILLAGYIYGLPAAAERIASRIPIETEKSLGIQALNYLDEKEWLNPTSLEPDIREEIRDNFDQLCAGLPLKKYYHLEFRKGVIFGSNAIAFPGGIIIITDEMAADAEEMEEVLAVLAHEVGHVELHHTMRSVLQNSAVGILVATVTSDAATLSAAVTGFPMLLAQTKYSRDFEAAADDYAFELLKQKGYSPEAFASLMERLAKNHGNESRLADWISTHPVTSDRIKRARDAE
jgi:Zn-dependent protease with chaperone function